MKTLILYATKYGSTKKCACLLAEKLPGQTEMKQIHEPVDPMQFDQIIIGSPVRMGQVDKKIL